MRRALIGLAALGALALVAHAGDDERGVLANLVSRALSSRTTQVSIGAVDGALSSDATIRDIVLSDRDGPWLKIDRARLVWSRLALLKRRLEIDSLEIGHIVWLRPALKAAQTAPGAPLEWPDLPVKAIVKRFTVANFDLGAPILGAPAQLSFAGSASLGPPAEGLDLKLIAKRLDAPGAVTVRFAYAPQTTQTTLALDADEPQGGLLARAANLPGAPPVTFHFDGAGPLDAFHAGLAFTAGAQVSAQGAVDLARQGAGRRLRLDLAGGLAGLLPSVAAPAFAGETRLRGDVALSDDGSAITQGVSLESDSARLDAVGGRAADGKLDLTIQAHAKANTTLDRLDLSANVKGFLPRPAADVTLEAANLKSPEGTLGHLSAHFTANPTRPDDPATPLALSGEAQMQGLALADPARASLVGSRGRLGFRAAMTPDGALDIADLSLDADALHAHFVGKAARDALSGQLSADADDLGKFGLRGSAHVEAALSANPSLGRYSADLDAQARGFAAGQTALDGWFGAAPSLRGAVTLEGGAYRFDKLALKGAGGGATLDGSLGPASTLTADVTIPDAKKLDSRVAGAASATFRLTGPLAAPDADLALALTDGRLLGRPARLTLTAQAKAGAKAKVALDGEIDGRKLQGGLDLTRDAGVIALDRAVFSFGRAKLEGAGRWANGLADGRLTIEAPKLDDLTPLALTPLSGALQADIALSSSADRQNAKIRAHSREAGFGAARIVGLAVDMTLTDLYGDIRPEGSAAALRVTAAGETLTGLRLAAKSGALDLAATLRGLSLRAKGVRTAARTLRLDSFVARGRGQSFDLAAPATLSFTADGVETPGLALQLGGGGRISLKGRAGGTLALEAKADAVPLGLADLAAPGLGLTGRASGAARLKGAAAAPTGDWKLEVSGLSAPAIRSAGLPPLGLRASGQLVGDRTRLDATISAGAAGALRFSGAAPLKSGAPFDLAVSGRLDVAALTRTLAARGQRASGALALDVKLAGDFAHPKASGGATLSGAAFADEISGFRLQNLFAAIIAHGEEIEISRLSGQTPGGGSVTAAGRVRLDPAAGFPGAIHLRADNARLAATDIVTAQGGFSLDLTGALAQSPRVTGRVDLAALDVEIPGRLPGGAAPLADVRHIAPGPTARARLAQRARKPRGGGAFKAELALEVSAPSRVTVHGRGVDAEFGGQLQVKGTTDAPHLVGGFDLRRGALTLIGGPMTFSRGRLSFEGDATPSLDMEARVALSDATAIVDVTGPADKPVFAFSSSPQLPQDEILSRILFKKPSGNLSAFQALQLANTVSALSGQGGAFDSLRRSLGVDSLDVTSSASGGPVVGARRALGDRLSVGVQTGAKPQDNGVSLDLDITKRLRLSTGVDAKGESKVGAGVQWEY